jgi:hypothetical protein
MASWWFAGKRAAVLAAVVMAAAPAVAQDADAALTRVADEAAAKGLPTAPLTNKIREGLAKGVDPKRIEQVIRQMAANLETADRFIREIDPAVTGAVLTPGVAEVESLGSGVTLDQCVSCGGRRSVGAGRPVTAETMASAAKGLSLIEEVRLPVADGTAVMAETVRQGYRPAEILDVAREVRRREPDYRAGRASLAALRDAIARGGRPDQLFRDVPAPAGDRPAARPQQPPDRPATERPAARPETPQRSDQPSRPERPGR